MRMSTANRGSQSSSEISGLRMKEVMISQRGGISRAVVAVLWIGIDGKEC